MTSLTLEGQAGTDLVASLVELGSVKRETETESGATVELGVVGKGSNTAVVDLGLWFVVCQLTVFCRLDIFLILTLAKETGSSLYLLATSSATFLPPWRS